MGWWMGELVLLLMAGKYRSFFSNVLLFIDGADWAGGSDLRTRFR